MIRRELVADGAGESKAALLLNELEQVISGSQSPSSSDWNVWQTSAGVT
jgi:hypothetical protein